MKKERFYIIAILIIGFFVVIESCSPTKYVPDGKYIVNKVNIDVDDSNIKTSKLRGITQTVPLKKVIGLVAFRTMIYNIPNPSKDGKRKTRKEKKLDKKNARKDSKFDRQSDKLRKKRNVYFNKKNRLKKEGDSVKYSKANEKYLELEKKVKQRVTFATDLKYKKHKKDIWSFADFFRKIGQEPQIYDTFFVDFTIKQYETYLKNQGYFNPIIVPSIERKNNKRINITYDIVAGKPLKIGSINYKFPEQNKDELVKLFQNQDLRLKIGQILDINDLETFRNKISSFYRNNGYYYFSNQLITYDIDTTGKYGKAALTVNFKNKVNPKVYEKWYINNIFIFNDYNPTKALNNPKEYLTNIDTSLYFSEDFIDYYILKKNQIVIKPIFITKQLYLYPDSLFSLKNTQTSYSHLSKYRIYKLTNIEFSETDDSTKNYLDCNIKLSPDKKTDIIYELEATNSSLSNGGAANLSYVHRNLFKGGEILDLKFEFAFQRQKTLDTTSSALFNTQEYSFNLNVTFPRLLIPFKSSNFIMQNNPRTIILTKFAYQDRPEFNKVEAILNWDYYMKSSQFSNFTFTPLRFSSTRVLYIAPEYLAYIKSVMLEESYDDHFVFGSRFSYTFSNQGKGGNTMFFQTNVAVAGNSLFAIMKSSNADTSNGVYNFPLFETPFAQFVKADIDYRYYINSAADEQHIIFRLFVGAGIPYGNSNLMPFGEKYFSGGANSIRAWQARTIGPGEYAQPEELIYINQTGDIKIELNFEYRFNIISILEGAFFVDAGNIWDFYSLDEDATKMFAFNKFYKQFAVGTGVGLRLNSSYFVFRTDLGLKLVDPTLPESSRIIPLERDFEWEDFSLNIGIGYPF